MSGSEWKGIPRRLFFTRSDWAKVRASGKLSTVLKACQDAEIAERKKAPAESGEDLSEDRRWLVNYVKSLSDEDAKVLRGFVELSSSRSGK